MARDADSGEILAFRCSVSKSPEDGKKFIESVLASLHREASPQGREEARTSRSP